MPRPQSDQHRSGLAEYLVKPQCMDWALDMPTVQGHGKRGVGGYGRNVDSTTRQTDRDDEVDQGDVC